MSEVGGRLATAIVRRYRDRFGRGPTEAKAYVRDDHAFGDPRKPPRPTWSGRLISRSESDSVELLRRRVRQFATDEFSQVAEEIVGRKVTVMLGDHNAEANVTALVFLFERDQE